MKIVARIFAGLTLANLLAFGIIAHYLGGDAINGRMEGGRYYLATHGHSTEVTQAVYAYSKMHAISVIVTIAIVLFGSLWARWRR